MATSRESRSASETDATSAQSSLVSETDATSRESSSASESNDYREALKVLTAENDRLRKENEILTYGLIQAQAQVELQVEALLAKSTNTSCEGKQLIGSGKLKNISVVESGEQKVESSEGVVKLDIIEGLGEGAREVSTEEKFRGGEYGKRDGTSRGLEQENVEDQGKSGRCSGVFVASGHTLNAGEIRRYSRQLLVPSFGVAGQERLLNSSALVVGCGGLGSPIALYLAAAGVGRLGLLDHDLVELSNLHRQIIHTEASIGTAKVLSAALACLKLNSSSEICTHNVMLKATNAVEIISNYDLVLDATDNLPTRYLLSDACVVTGKPLVSGAALGVEGQVTVYNHDNGHCYRCLFPIPPPRGTRQSCSNTGVIGLVPGIVGVFQALEALKIIAGVGETLSSRMLLLDVLSTRIHTVKLRARNPACVACGDEPQILLSNLHNYDYEGFTQSPILDEVPMREILILDSDRISCNDLARHVELGQAHVLLDVREAHEYAISALPNSINIPFSCLKENVHVLQAAADKSRFTQVSKLGCSDRPEQATCTSNRSAGNSEMLCKEESVCSSSNVPSPAIYVVCRRGNDSQRAVQLLRTKGFSNAVDIIGGLESWVKNVDAKFPIY